ncbi:hypothetical protein FRB90_001623, partial [Tulasnella sp. 427]
MTTAHSNVNGNTASPGPHIDATTSTSRSAFKQLSTPMSPRASSTPAHRVMETEQEEQDEGEGWDTANEGTVEGDAGGVDEEEQEDEPPMSPEEIEHRRRLKGKSVQVASEGDELNPAPTHRSHHQYQHPQNPHRQQNGRPNLRHFSTPPPLTFSSAGANDDGGGLAPRDHGGLSAASSGPIVTNGIPPSNPNSGLSRRSLSIPYNDETDGQMLSAPIIPSVNVIPNSPPPPPRSSESRQAAGSLDIPHTLTESSSQESLKRRETVGMTAASATERRKDIRRRSVDEIVPSPRQRRLSLPASPPPPYANLTPPASGSEQISGQTSNSTATPTAASSQSTSFVASQNVLAVPEEAAGPSRERNGSISTLSPPVPAHTVVPPTANDEEDPVNEKGKGVDRTGGPLADDEKELERTVESDDEALDPVAAGPSASAALDERTSAIAAATAAAEAQAMIVSPVESDNRNHSIRRPSVSASLSARRQGRPSNLDLSPAALGAPSANLPVVASSPAPTLRSMRQALSHSDTVRRPVLAPRSPRASTSLSLSGLEDGTPDSPTEIGEDFISFAQALAESRLPSVPALASGPNPNRASTVPLVVKPAVPASSIISALAASRNSTSGLPESSASGIYANIPVPPPPPLPPVPKETSQAAKKRRRFSMVPFTKASASGGSSRTSRTSVMPMSAASASTPNLVETGHGHGSAQASAGVSSPPGPGSFSALAESLPPPSAPASVGRSQSNTSLAPIDGPSSSAGGRNSLMPSNTVDRIFGHQTAPSSPMKTSRSATSFHSTGSASAPSVPSPPSPRASRRFLPKLFTGLKKNHEARNSRDQIVRQRSEAEKRLAAGGAASAAALSATMLENPDAAPTPEEGLPPSETIVTSVVTVGDDPLPRNRLSMAPGPGGPTAMMTELNHIPSLTALSNGEGTASEPATATATPLPTLPAGTTAEELAALAAVSQFGPYTTFQQLSYAPAFPLGTIADDYIIPPTYPDFLDYRKNHEPDALSITEILAAPNSPSTLGPTPPIPAPAPAPPPGPPPKWFYIDPKGVIQGPWKSTLMQSWFDDGFLPPDLPVRRDTETEYTPLKVLCANAKRSEQPFRPPTPPPTPPTLDLSPVPNVLLHPISTLSQPRRFGPPALFYTSRGGHSTSIVDSKGKSVLRGRITWTPDDETTRLGDVKQLEAFDTRNRAVLLA